MNQMLGFFGAIWPPVPCPMFAQEEEHPLTANFREMPGRIITDQGAESTAFLGSVGLRVVSAPRRTPTIIRNAAEPRF
ncbi:MAG: hypothetical protein ACUVQS_03475 [Candidatus Bipolaricaulaceae bacterium]